jgi:glycosyltransferase involved in cell wall biosynthesis
MSQFPETHETFILRELRVVCGAPELSVEIVSLKPCRDRIIHPDARVLMKRTIYPTGRSVARGLLAAVRSASVRTVLASVMAANRGSAMALVKAFVTVILAVGFLEELRQRRVEHIHAHWATLPALAAYVTKRVAGIPYSITAHAWDIYAERTMLLEKIENAAFVVTCTAANRRALLELGVPTEKVHLCYHGLDFSAIRAPRFGRGRDMDLLAVGRLVEQKGFSVLVDACARLKQRGWPLRARIIGEGPLRTELERLIVARGLSDQIQMPGLLTQAEVFCGYHDASVFVAPSVIAADGDRDGIPNVILEAMSQGIPVVSTAVSGIPEVVHPGRTGWLVPPGDPLALADAIEAAHLDASGDVARNAYQLVRQKFDVERNTVALAELFSNPRSAATCPR